MHSFLKSIGFSNIKTIRDQDELIGDVLRGYDFKKVAANAHHQLFAQISKEYAPDMGVTVCGYYDEDNLFHVEYHYPYYTGSQVTSYQQVVIEKQASSESYAGACDDMRVGTTLIFYVINAGDYLSSHEAHMQDEFQTSLSLSGLADSGMILLPLEKDKTQLAREQKKSQQKTSLYNAAANGDQEAIESLTIEDIDTYTMIARRIQHEDVYTIVDSYFMPYGLECDLYNIMGEITDVRLIKNPRTEEELYQLGILTNEIPLDICINRMDLTGEPAVGRRFKGIIWLQGMVNF